MFWPQGAKQHFYLLLRNGIKCSKLPFWVNSATSCISYSYTSHCCPLPVLLFPLANCSYAVWPGIMSDVSQGSLRFIIWDLLWANRILELPFPTGAASLCFKVLHQANQSVLYLVFARGETLISYIVFFSKCTELLKTCQPRDWAILYSWHNC